MKNTKQLIVVALVGVLLCLHSMAQAVPVDANELIPERGVASAGAAGRWDYGFLTGNGRIGAIVYGQPNHETIVFNHERLYLPTPRPEMPDLGKTFDEVRRIAREEGHIAARNFSLKQAIDQGHFNYHSDPFHLAFELKLVMPAKGAVKDYLRTTDFQTGEVSTHWSDDDGKYVRKLFVSRPDNVAVLSILPPDAKKLNLSISTVPIVHDLIDSDLSVDDEWITSHNAYALSPGGYDNVMRVITKGGHAKSDGNKIVITDADEVLILTTIKWYENLKDGSVATLKKSMLDLPQDYKTLLQPHAAAHGEIFNRVTLDLDGGKDSRITSDELLGLAWKSSYTQIPSTLIEKMYDASRFYFICSAGDLPPNLQGIWNGVFTAPWNGSYTFDANVELAMDSALSGNMTEGMEGYFKFIESLVPDWRINAKNLFGARGVSAQIVASPNTGLHLHYEGVWAWQFWTQGGGWLSSYFYDYYRFTGDKVFLKNRAIPLMKEVALFYEDYLQDIDDNGNYIFPMSCSPEVGGVLLSNNSVLDVAVATELLTNLIAGCEELQIEKDNVVKWQAMLKKMPPYQTGPDGDIAEWADGTFNHAYNHRHYSPFYPVFRSFEFSPETTPELWNAAEVSLEKKRDLWLHHGSDWWGIPFGRVFHAQSAAYLGQGDVVDEIVNSMADRLYPSLHMSLRPNGGMFNFDGNGAYPDIINRSLAFSLDGTLDLLRSVPPSWDQGSIHGILVRGQIKIDRLQWHQSKGIINLELTSSIDQQITLRVPASKSIKSLKIIEGTAKADASTRGENARKVTLPANGKVKIEIHHDLVERKAIRTDLALNKTVTASSYLQGGYDSNLAVDGNLHTRWSSVNSDPQWLSVDLGKEMAVDAVELSWEAACGECYTIEVSTDNVNWTEVYSTKEGKGGRKELKFAPIKARWIRMHGTERSTIYGYSLWSFKVYGK